MKTTFDEFGGLEMITEDGRDILWVNEMLINLGKDGRKNLEGHLHIDFDNCHLLEDGSRATDMTPEEAIDNTGAVWGSVQKIYFSAINS